MSEHLFEIKIADEQYARLAKGIMSAEPDNNEETDQTKYLDGDGFGETDVIGAQLIVAFSGHRYYGDPAQDYIYSNMLKLGAGRRTDFRWTQPNGDVLEGSCTIAAITGPSGDAGAKGEIGFEIHFNGKIELQEGGAAPATAATTSTDTETTGTPVEGATEDTTA